MRVVQVATLAGPDSAGGGVWAVAEVQTEALRENGIATTLVAGWGGSDVPVPDDSNTDVFIRLRKLLPRTGLRFMWALGLRAKLTSIIAASDIVHIHLCRDYVSNLALRIANRRGIPVVAQCHGMLSSPTSALARLYDRLFLRRHLNYPYRFVFLTDRERADLLAMGIPQTSLVRVRNATSERGKAEPIRSGFAFISRFDPRKQPIVFVRAAIARLRAGSSEPYLLAGPDQGEYARVREAVDASGMGHAIEVRSSLSRNEVHDTLARNRALVLPSVEEPYPMIVIEAAAVGTPSILTSSCGMADELRKANAALIVDPEPDEVARAMEVLESDVNQFLLLSKDARAYYEANWTPDVLAKTLIAIYKDAPIAT